MGKQFLVRDDVSGSTGYIEAAQAGLSLPVGNVSDLEISVLAYRSSHGVDPGGGSASNSTAGINAAILAASAEATARAASSGVSCRARLIFPRGVYLCDAINPAPNVELMLDAATLAKRSNALNTATTNNLIYAPETNAGGSYYGHYQNFKISGGYLSANGKTAWGSLVRMLWMENLEIDGLEWLDYAPPAAGSGFSGSWALNFGGRDVLVLAPRIRGGANVNDDGIHFVHGEDFRLVAPDVDSGDDMVAVGGINTASLVAEPDNIKRVTITGIDGTSQKGHALRVHVEAGLSFTVDDVTVQGIAAQTGILRNAGIYIVDEDRPAIGSELISNITIDGMELEVGSTSHDEVNAVGVRVESARNVRVNGNVKMTDKTGASVGFRLAYVRDAKDLTLDLRCAQLAKAIAIDAARTTRMKIRGKLEAGTTTTTPINLGIDCADTDVDAEILNVQNAQNGIQATTAGTTSLTFGGRVAHAAGATTGKGIYAASIAKLAIKPGADLSGCPEPLDLAFARLIPTLSIPDGIIGVSRASLIASHFDDFMGDVLADEWAGFKGTDATAALPVIAATLGGAARLVTGADAGGTMALNGSRLESIRDFVPSKVGLAFEARVAVSAITDLCVFIGLTNQAGLLSMPFTWAGAVLTSNPADAVGFSYDSTATVTNWQAVGVATNVDATAQDLGVAPTANINTYATFRIEVSSAGTATFFINGVKRGVAMTGAVGVVVLEPVVAAFSRAAASRTVDVDYVLCEQHR